jgi:hypothetical protein
VKVAPSLNDPIKHGGLENADIVLCLARRRTVVHSYSKKMLESGLGGLGGLDDALGSAPLLSTATPESNVNLQ